MVASSASASAAVLQAFCMGIMGSLRIWLEHSFIRFAQPLPTSLPHYVLPVPVREAFVGAGGQYRRFAGLPCFCETSFGEAVGDQWDANTVDLCSRCDTAPAGPFAG